MGHMQRTPARVSGSTNKQAAGAALADKCVKHLDRLADEAKNFEVPSFQSVYDYRSSPAWRTCCERIEEWVRKAADSEKTYGERLRDLLCDKSAMEKQAKKNRPAFNFQIHRLFRAIRKIYRTARNSPTMPTQRMTCRIIGGRDGLEHDIERRIARHRSQILRARKAPFEEFYVWRAKERNRRAHANTAESESKLPATQSRRGRDQGDS